MNVHFFDGGNALSDFRIRQLLPRLQAVNPAVDSVSARYVHLAGFDTAPPAADLERLAALLTYGDPAAEGAEEGRGEDDEGLFFFSFFSIFG